MGPCGSQWGIKGVAWWRCYWPLWFIFRYQWCSASCPPRSPCSGRPRTCWGWESEGSGWTARGIGCLGWCSSLGSNRTCRWCKARREPSKWKPSGSPRRARWDLWSGLLHRIRPLACFCLVGRTSWSGILGSWLVLAPRCTVCRQPFLGEWSWSGSGWHRWSRRPWSSAGCPVV